ncbi:hypothetical protein ACFE04_030097 [Oxalis oulophora]
MNLFYFWVCRKSSRINTTLVVNGLTPLLIARLDHQDAIARLNLLKLIKAVYEHHPRPEQLIVENDLPQKLQNLIEARRDGQRSGGQGRNVDFLAEFACNDEVMSEFVRLYGPNLFRI